MARPIVPPDPQSATEYDNRTTEAVKSVLVEMGQILGAYKGRFALIGGAVPWLLLNNRDMPHVGTLDVDIALDAEALGDGEYATLTRLLLANGYQQSAEHRRFQLVRQIDVRDGGPPTDVVVDFLMPRGARVGSTATGRFTNTRRHKTRVALAQPPISGAAPSSDRWS